MANYFTRFSVMLPLGSPERIKPALEIYRTLADDLGRDEGAEIGFDAAASPEVDPAALWLSAEEDGNPEHVIAFVRLCGEAFGLTGRWGFRWALTCSRMRLDGLGRRRARARPCHRRDRRVARLRGLARRAAFRNTCRPGRILAGQRVRCRRGGAPPA